MAGLGVLRSPGTPVIENLKSDAGKEEVACLEGVGHSSAMSRGLLGAGLRILSLFATLVPDPLRTT